MLSSGIVYDILRPNLYCVLALEALGHDTESPKNLSTIVDGFDVEFTRVSRSLSQVFPDTLRELFRIRKKTTEKNSPYEISTSFPELLVAVLNHAQISPLSTDRSTVNSIIYSKQFYDACIEAVAPNGVWSGRSFAEYYLFERIFRLNTKFTLFWAEYNAETGMDALSPRILADFFLHSPLVLFPQISPPTQQKKSSQANGKLLHLFYESSPDSGAHVHPTRFLHFLIQLSSFWFPQVLGILRTYMKSRKITSFDDVDRFFFPVASKSDDFSSFREKYVPTTKEFSSYEKGTSKNGKSGFKLPRASIDCYSKRWYRFALPSLIPVEALVPQSLDNWKRKLSSTYPELQDHYAITEIQQTLP